MAGDVLAFAAPTINYSQLGMGSAGRGVPSNVQPAGAGVNYVAPALGRGPAAVWVGMIALLIILRIAYEWAS